MVMKNKKMPLKKMIDIHSKKKLYHLKLKKKNDEISKINARLEIINFLTQNTGKGMPPEEIIANIFPKLQALIPFNILALYLFLKDSSVRRILFYTGRKGKIKMQESLLQDEQLQSPSPELKKKVGSTLLSIFQGKKPPPQKNISPEAYSLPRNLNLKKQGAVSELIIPLAARGKVIGALEIAGNRNFRTGDLTFGEQLGNQLSICLENIRLYNENMEHEQGWKITSAAVTDLLVFIDQNLEIQKVNKAAQDFFTLSEKDILGQKCYTLFYGRTSKCNPCLADQVRQNRKTVYLQSRTRYNRVLEILAHPACMQDEFHGVAYYAKDITRFVDSVKFTSLGEMSVGVAHELNSPLTAIVGNSQLLLREIPSSSPHYQLVKDIKACGWRCQGIIQNLLALSRQDEISFEELDLNKIIERAFSLVSYQVEKKEISLINTIKPLPQHIMGNSQGLEQIIVNLLLNARDAIAKKNTEKNDGAAEKGSVTISTRMLPEKKFIAVDITDNGCGIEAEKIPQIFNPFHTTKKPGKGTGLGLSVSLGIAQAHGGFIDVESIPGKGSTFSLILPFHRPNRTDDAEGNN